MIPTSEIGHERTGPENGLGGAPEMLLPPLPDGPPLLHYSVRQDTLIWPPTISRA